MNDKKVNFANKPLQYEESNLVPLREISKALGASFTYDAGSGTIGLTKDKYKITLTLVSKTYFTMVCLLY
ncbi:stalk domain-containing protein [Paenibacillus xylanexedens]|uniref:stalk domain-containing protein n=1 Tax=Paenibacillus xylanexedens TaxID=528191 RepID=UPI001F0C1078|nr:stalk domain-containing protein [Paenibacillus xylanexedens]